MSWRVGAGAIVTKGKSPFGVVGIVRTGGKANRVKRQDGRKNVKDG